MPTQPLTPLQAYLLKKQASKVAAVPEQSFVDKMGGWRGVGAAGVRGLAGLLSMEGGALGAGISTAGETGAELLEGSDLSPSRIAVEAGLGAIPFSSVFKAGRPVASLLRGGLYAGVGTAGREMAEGKPFDPSAIGTSAAIGGGVGGGLAKLFGGAGRVAAKAIPTVSANSIDELSRLPVEMPGRPMVPSQGIQDAIRQFPRRTDVPAKSFLNLPQTVAEQERLKFSLQNDLPTDRTLKDIIRDKVASAKAQTTLQKGQDVALGKAHVEDITGAAKQATAKTEAERTLSAMEDLKQPDELDLAREEARRLSLAKSRTKVNDMSVLADVEEGAARPSTPPTPSSAEPPSPVGALKNVLTPTAKVAESTPAQRAAFDTANQADIAAQKRGVVTPNEITNPVAKLADTLGVKSAEKAAPKVAEAAAAPAEKPMATWAGWGDPAESGQAAEPWFHLPGGTTVMGEDAVRAAGFEVPPYKALDEAERVAAAAAKNAPVAEAFGEKIAPTGSTPAERAAFSPGVTAKMKEWEGFLPDDQSKIKELSALFNSKNAEAIQAAGFKHKGALMQAMKQLHTDALERAAVAKAGTTTPIKTIDDLLNTVKANPVPEAPLTPPAPVSSEPLTKTQMNRSPGFVKQGRRELEVMNALTPDAQAIAKTMYPDRELFSLTTDEISEVRLAEQMLDAKKAGKIPTMPGEGPVPPSEIQETAIAANARAKAADIRLQRGAAKAPASPLLQTLTAKAAETPKTPSFDAMASFLKLQKAGVPIEKLKTMPASEVEAMLAEMEGKAGPGAVTTEQAAATPPTLRKVKTLPTQLNSEEQIAAQARDQSVGNKLRRGTRSKPSSDIGMAYPELMARLGLGATGAAVGGVVGAQQDPLGNKPMSALAGGLTGGLMGAALPSLPGVVSGLLKMGAAPAALANIEEKISSPEGLKAAARHIASTLPSMQRFNYLFNVHGLTANAIGGPVGSGVMAAVEHILSGDSRGWAVLKQMTPTNFGRMYMDSLQEASDLIEHSAEGTMVGRADTMGLGEMGGHTATKLDHLLSLPGMAMTAGDVTVRKMLVNAGFSEEEARIITLTSEPFTRSGLSGAHARGWLTSMLFPFKRTPINIAEQGLLRTPGIGFLMHGMEGAPAASLRQQVVQQGLGAGSGYLGYELGKNMSPENARVYRRYISNLGGQYSAPVTLGFGLGQAARLGTPDATTVARQVEQALPLPSTSPIAEWGRLAAHPTTAAVPRGAYPGIFRDFKEMWASLQPKPASDYDRLFPKVK
jgi:hypothetical protein